MTSGCEIQTGTHAVSVEIRLGEPLTGSLQATLEALSALPGRVSYLVRKTDGTKFDRFPDEPLAVGSAFKLGVLKVLTDDIAAGRHHWDEVMRLAESDRSLPTGALQDFPEGAPSTLHSLAAVMIAESDNTATDMLMRLLGNERIAKALGLEDVLTTRAFFQLEADPVLALRFGEADAGGRQLIRDQFDNRGLPSPTAASTPYRPGVEWHVPVKRLCDLAEAVIEADVFVINPGPVRREHWSRIAYKGGSETGVLTMTAALRHADGRTGCISVTVNADGPVDEVQFSGLFTRLARQLAAAPL